jgi:hypothetical protein
MWSLILSDVTPAHDQSGMIWQSMLMIQESIRSGIAGAQVRGRGRLNCRLNARLKAASDW